MNGTTAAAHLSGTDILLLDKLVVPPVSVDMQGDGPYSDIVQNLETNKFFNFILDSEDRTEIKDTESIEKFGERRFALDLPLSAVQVPWRSYLNAKALERLSQIRGHVEVTLPAAFYLDIGDVVAYQGPGDILFPGRIIDIRHTETGDAFNLRRDTHLILEEIKPPARVSFPGGTTLSDKTFTQDTAGTPWTLPAAENPKASYVYRVDGLPVGMTFDAETREVDPGTPRGVLPVTAVTYTVVDSDKPTSMARLTFNITVNAAALAFVGEQPDLFFPVGVTVSEWLIGARGGSGRKTYALTGTLPTGVSFNPTGRRLAGTATAQRAGQDYTLRVTDTNSNSDTETFSIVTGRSDRLVVFTGSYARFWDFQRQQHASENFRPSGLTSSDSVRGAGSSPSRIALLVRSSSPTAYNVLVYDRGWGRLTTEGTTLDATKQWDGLAWCSLGYWLLANRTDRKIIWYDTDWNEVSDREMDINLLPEGLAVTAERIYTFDAGNPNNTIKSWTFDGTEVADEQTLFASNGYGIGGATSLEDGIYVYDNYVFSGSSGGRLRFLDNDLSLNVSRQINAGLSSNLRTSVGAIMALNPPDFLQ